MYIQISVGQIKLCGQEFWPRSCLVAPQNIIYQSIYHISAYSANSRRQACGKWQAPESKLEARSVAPKLSDHLNHHKNGHSNWIYDTPQSCLCLCVSAPKEVLLWPRILHSPPRIHHIYPPSYSLVSLAIYEHLSKLYPRDTRRKLTYLFNSLQRYLTRLSKIAYI